MNCDYCFTLDLVYYSTIMNVLAGLTPASTPYIWITDKFGVTWQIVPRILDELMRNPEKAEAVTAAFMPMKKLDLEAIRKAGE